jgi:hypothetical protein
MLQLPRNNVVHVYVYWIFICLKIISVANSINSLGPKFFYCCELWWFVVLASNFSVLLLLYTFNSILKHGFGGILLRIVYGWVSRSWCKVHFIFDFKLIKFSLFLPYFCVCTAFPLWNLILAIQNSVFQEKVWRLSRE